MEHDVDGGPKVRRPGRDGSEGRGHPVVLAEGAGQLALASSKGQIDHAPASEIFHAADPLPRPDPRQLILV